MMVYKLYNIVCKAVSGKLPYIRYHGWLQAEGQYRAALMCAAIDAS